MPAPIIMSHVGVAVAAAARARMREEEENMTAYNREDLDGWEFKIVRSISGKFKKHEAIQRVCQEEAKAGWELMEKFDDYRMRFKRRVEMRSRDQFLETDPYRTNVGINPGTLGMIGVAALIIIIAVVFFVTRFHGR